jgi:hypothetical protein
MITIPGTYNYKCDVHVSAGMTGTFTVAASGVRHTGRAQRKPFGSPRNGSSNGRVLLRRMERAAVRNLFDFLTFSGAGVGRAAILR